MKYDHLIRRLEKTILAAAARGDGKDCNIASALDAVRLILDSHEARIEKLDRDLFRLIKLVNHFVEGSMKRE